MIVFVILIIAVIIGFSYYFNFLSRSNFLKILKIINTEYKLKLKEGNMFSYPSLKGCINGKSIEISKETYKKNSYLNINISHDINMKDMKADFNIKKKFLFSKIKLIANINDYKTYDETFDEKMFLTANQEVFFTALLNKKIRDDILETSDNVSYIDISRHGITLKLSIGMFSSKIPGAVNVIKSALDISNNMTKKISLKQRLIDNIKKDNNNIVRLNNLHYLIDNFPDDKQTQEYFKTLLNDIDLDIQITAAKELKEEGLKHLFNLLQKQHKSKIISNPGIIIIFGEKKYLKSIPILLDIYKETNIKELKYVILYAFNLMGDQSLSSFLVNELKSEDNKLRDKIIKALGTCGTREAVEPLFILNKTIIKPAVKNLILETIGKIQSRLENSGKGNLSVAEYTDNEGALSISNESEEGGLSITEDGK